MKNLIRTILRTGLTKSKKPLEDYVKYLYPLKHILTVNQLGWVVCNDNGFWKPENNQNRTELFNDVYGIHKKSIAHNNYFHKINNLELYYLLNNFVAKLYPQSSWFLLFHIYNLHLNNL